MVRLKSPQVPKPARIPTLLPRLRNFHQLILPIILYSENANEILNAILMNAVLSGLDHAVFRKAAF